MNGINDAPMIAGASTLFFSQCVLWRGLGHRLSKRLQILKRDGADHTLGFQCAKILYQAKDQLIAPDLRELGGEFLAFCAESDLVTIIQGH